jgi:hypothetical protein
MSNLTILMVFTVAALLTMVVTTPGAVLYGFKLRAAVMLSSVGTVLTVITSDAWITANDWQVIHSRIVDTQAGWLTLAWLILLVPYSKKSKERRKELIKIYNRK